jgi:quercetin dioxygenase-like cupin family protein
MNKLTFNSSLPLSAIRKIPAAVKGRHLALAALVAGLFSAVALATPGAGIISAPVQARASFVDPTDVKFTIKGAVQKVVQVSNSRENVIQQIILGPGGHTGWHSHPGPVVVLIKSGQMSFYDGDDPGCKVRTYTAGQAFVDAGQGHVHIARNESATENLELWATYFDVPPGGAFRIDAANPGNCPGF